MSVRTALRSIPLPPPDEDFTADASELFFDLVFVFAFSRLVYHLVHEPTWSGVGEFGLLFTLIWMPWSQFTWSANAVAGNSRPVRALFLVATVASVPMAASVTTAFEGGGPAFAISACVILSMALFTMIVGLGDQVVVRAAIIRYSIPNWIAMVFIVGGSFFDREVRIGAWVVALAVLLAGTIRAGADEWLIRPGHFAERHGLILIVALGEVIVALGSPINAQLEEGGGLAAETMLALLAAGTFAALLWWAYFDRPSPALEHRHEQLEGGHARGRFARDVFTYAHFPLTAGVVLATAGLEEITLHPTDPLPTAFRWMFAAGLMLFLLAVVVAVGRAFRVVAYERLVACGALVLLGFGGGDIDAVVLLVVVDIVLFGVLVAEHRRIE